MNTEKIIYLNIDNSNSSDIDNSDDVPNLGSIITLDNKGRLINSQFSKPSLTQGLHKYNASENIPDADDLPNSVISYGDTQNIINLPYNDHNYVGSDVNKVAENYDKKAIDYMKQTNNTIKNNGTLRISQYNSYSSSYSSNFSMQHDNSNRSDDFFITEKPKPQQSSQQFIFNHSVSNTSTPLINSRISNVHSNLSSAVFASRKQIMGTNAYVINPNPLNRVKAMSVIKVHRPSIEMNNETGLEPRIINLPMKHPPTLTSLISNDQISSEISATPEKQEFSKSYNLIPRCICGYKHDDGGMIRCEICQTWQHIICMYPDNKFPIFYKCERCEPREVDYNHALEIQTNKLINAGHNPSDFLSCNDYNDYDIDQNISQTQSQQYVIVQPDSKTSYYTSTNSLQSLNTPLFVNSTNSQLVPPGSPRTSKRKQDLISLKNMNPNAPLSPTPMPSIINSMPLKSSLELQKQITDNNAILTSSRPPNFVAQTTTNQMQFHQTDNHLLNQMSVELKTALNYVHNPHTNLSIHQLQFLKQYNFKIGNSGFEVVLVSFNQHAIRAAEEFTSTEVIMEYNGSVCLAEEVLCDYDYRKYYNPYLLFYEKFNQIPLCINTKDISTLAMYIRRSCTPNAEIKHRYLQNGTIYFYIVPINHIGKDSEITIGFGFDFTECRYPVECACNQPSCQVKMGKALTKITNHYHPSGGSLGNTSGGSLHNNSLSSGAGDMAPQLPPLQPSPHHHQHQHHQNSGPATDQQSNFDASYYNVDNYNYVMDNSTLQHKSPTPQPPQKRQYRKRGRGTKIIGPSNRVSTDKSTAESLPSPVKPLVRRNKRGRPPLNRANGMQRSDLSHKAATSSIQYAQLSQPLPTTQLPLPACHKASTILSIDDLDNDLDNELTNSPGNETNYQNSATDETSKFLAADNVSSSYGGHSNFKNFKRISASQWSIKAHRKLMNMKKTKSSPQMPKRKVGRPLKNRDKVDPVGPDSVHSYGSDNNHHQHNRPTEETYSHEFKEELDEHFMSIDDAYERHNSSNSESKKHDSGRDEGKYWLEEINNKINKQKLRETKKYKHRSSKAHRSTRESHHRMMPEMKLFDKQESLSDRESATLDVTDEQENLDDEEEQQHHNQQLEVYEPKVEDIYSDSQNCPEEEPIMVKSKEVREPREKRPLLHMATKKLRKMKKHIKDNSDYILSYKESNIDDLKKDLLLISASLEEDLTGDNCGTDVVMDEEKCNSETKKEKLIQIKAEDEEADDEAVEEVEVSEVIECEPVVLDDKVEEDEEHRDQDMRPTEAADDKQQANSSGCSSTNKMVKQQRRSSDSQPGGDSSSTSKASREERWVNIMWQRILQNEKSDGSGGSVNKIKRRRNKSSLTEENASDHKNDSVESNRESDQSDRHSKEIKSLKAKWRQHQKQHQQHHAFPGTNKDYLSSTDESDNMVSNDCIISSKQPVAVVDRGPTGEKKQPPLEDDNAAGTSLSSGPHDTSQDQCELIVYKEQDANPLEKFSRENSAKMFASDAAVSAAAAIQVLSPLNTDKHPPHAKKRWLSQALLEETMIDEKPEPESTQSAVHISEPENNSPMASNCSVLTLVTPLPVEPEPDTIDAKLAKIEHSSKRSFLPPVITSTAAETRDCLSPGGIAQHHLKTQAHAINPKKRLLNQFSMEDHRYLSNSNEDMKYSVLMGNEPEQSKTKLTLSEYRKRRYIDNGSGSGISVSGNNDSGLLTANYLKAMMQQTDPNSLWTSCDPDCKADEDEDNSESEDMDMMKDEDLQTAVSSPRELINQPGYQETVRHLQSLTSSQLEPIQPAQNNNSPIEPDDKADIFVSYITTLNQLTIPSRLDPRITRHLPILTPGSATAGAQEDTPASPEPVPGSGDFQEVEYQAGPRTPSDKGEPTAVLQTAGPARRQHNGSVHSLESQPSPTSDSYLDLERLGRQNAAMEVVENPALVDSIKHKLMRVLTDMDWTDDPSLVGRIAGIEQPHLLQEIDEYAEDEQQLQHLDDDGDMGEREWVACHLPQRSQQELETLLLTQQRDSQIRQWQSVRQLEREKNKLEHRVRNMQRRKQQHDQQQQRLGAAQIDTDALLNLAASDEQTMKTFNTHLSSINDKLLQQIQQIRKVPSKPEPRVPDLPSSYRISDEAEELQSHKKHQSPPPADEGPPSQYNIYPTRSPLSLETPYVPHTSAAPVAVPSAASPITTTTASSFMCK